MATSNSIYDMLKKLADDDEFYFDVKQKIELLLNKIIISNKNLHEMINLNLSFLLNDKLVSNSFAKKQYDDGLNISGEFYRQYNEVNIYPWDDWLEYNFNDYTTTINIYNRFLKSKNVCENDMLLLNRIFEKYE